MCVCLHIDTYDDFFQSRFGVYFFSPLKQAHSVLINHPGKDKLLEEDKAVEIIQ